jgi:hypothetical protein
MEITVSFTISIFADVYNNNNNNNLFSGAIFLLYFNKKERSEP